jgi:anti-sigma B factor antagonist
MSVKIQSENIEPDIVVVRLIGNITVRTEGHLLEPFLKELLDQGRRKLIFDLSGVEHVDSSGVELMFSCSSVVKAKGGQLALAGASQRVRRLFTITRLDSVLSFCASVEDACGAFRA